jgi:hypothetical protein
MVSPSMTEATVTGSASPGSGWFGSPDGPATGGAGESGEIALMVPAVDERMLVFAPGCVVEIGRDVAPISADGSEPAGPVQAVRIRASGIQRRAKRDQELGPGVTIF